MELLSRYKIQARIYPGLLVALPVAILAASLAPRSLATAISSTLAASGVLFLVANIVRTLGLRTEARLIHEWNGFPTTKRLRHRDSAHELGFQRRRNKLEVIYGENLPDHGDELRAPDAADRRYIAATRALIGRIEAVRDRFPRVEDENINYGFRRNLLGIKPYGISVAITSLAIDIFIAVRSSMTTPLIVTVIIHLCLLAVWIVIVKATWVREAADRYADRLFEALDAFDGSIGPDTNAS